MRNYKEEIKQMRKRTGLSQTKFAAFMEIPYTTFRKWEIGQSCPTEYTMKMMHKILEASDIDKDTLIKNLRKELEDTRKQLVVLELKNDELKRRLNE